MGSVGSQLVRWGKVGCYLCLCSKNQPFSLEELAHLIAKT
jgi:hypothetical protein